MDEGVVTHPADADIGSIFGWGFPPYTGGTISFIETEGVRSFVEEADRLARIYGERFAVPQSLRSMAEKGETFYQLAEAKQHRPAA
jgi:3-hydroxyacyl-CoA dehydrogenase/enoyl-CoA hydratase/3-hydroxybutyryl-CoA epimerase